MVWPLDSIGEWEPNFQWDDAGPSLQLFRATSPWWRRSLEPI